MLLTISRDNDETPKPNKMKTNMNGSVPVPVVTATDELTPTPENMAGTGTEREERPLAALSATLSASSSLSGSTQHMGDSPPMSHTRFKHYQKPTVTDAPELVTLCQQYIEERNIDGLARIARNRGLPPAYRQYAWPLLLSSHPHVVKPNMVREYPINNDEEDEEEKQQRDLVPLKKIEKDLERIQKKKSSNNNGKSVTQSFTTTPGTSSPSSSTTASTSSVNVSSAVNEFFSQSMEDKKFEMIRDAIVQFCQVHGDVVPYDTAMAYAAYDLSEWVDPVFEMAQAVKQGSQHSTPELTPLQKWEDSQTEQIAPFATVFEQLVIMMMHAPTLERDGPQGPCDSQFTERISEFLSAMRHIVPDLAKHFDDEDVWQAVGIEEWLIYWIKWVGVRAWRSEERARMWDMYLGWRPHHDSSFSTQLDRQREEQAGLCSHPFWNPVALQSDAILDWHLQHKFVCVAMIKSQHNVLMELDQSETRQFLTKFGKMKDLESIVEEAAEMYRAWVVTEEHDGNGDEYDE